MPIPENWCLPTPTCMYYNSQYVAANIPSYFIQSIINANHLIFFHKHRLPINRLPYPNLTRLIQIV